MTVIETPVNTGVILDGIFLGLSGLDRWSPWYRKLKKPMQAMAPWRYVVLPLLTRHSRWKYDKVPSNGRHGISTAELKGWTDLPTAITTAGEWRGLCGVSLVMTGGIEFDGWTLVGFDFDDVDFQNFTIPFKSYAEKSPSGNGVRMFAWVPVEWAKQYQDTLNATPPHCAHAEIYIGTAPRFLTVTFDVIQSEEIAQLKGKDLLTIESWGIHDFEAPKPDLPYIDVAGVVLDLDKFKFTIDQKHLIAGTVPETGKLDRSRTSMGFIIRLLDGGASQQDILATMVATPALLQYLLDHRNNDPDRAIEFARSEINRAYKDSMPGKRKQLTSFNDKWGDKPVTTPEPEVTAVAYPKPFRGVIAEATTAGLDVAHKPQPELTMLAVLIASAALCGSFYALASGCRLNLYGIGVLPTAGGKNQPQQQTKKLAAQGNVKIISAPASGEALEDDLLSHIGTYCVVDEIGHLLALTNARDAKAWHVSLMRKILDLYAAGADDNYYQRGKAGKPGRAIPNPALNIIGFTTPGVLAQALTLADIENGLCGRLLWVVSKYVPKNRRITKPFVMPKSFSSVAMRIKVNLAGSSLTQGAPVLVDIDNNADALLDELNDEFDLIGRDGDAPHERALCARSLENVEHIAGVLAVLDNPDKPMITVEHVEWAAQFVRASNAAVLGYVESEMHSGGEQKNAAILLKMISDGETKPKSTNEVAASKAGWVPRSALLRRSKMGVDREFEPAMRLLQKRDDIVEGSFGEKGLQVLRLKGEDE